MSSSSVASFASSFFFSAPASAFYINSFVLSLPALASTFSPVPLRAYSFASSMDSSFSSSVFSVPDLGSTSTLAPALATCKATTTKRVPVGKATTKPKRFPEYLKNNKNNDIYYLQ